MTNAVRNIKENSCKYYTSIQCHRVSQTMQMEKCPWVKVFLVQTIGLFPDFLQLCLVALDTPEIGTSARGISATGTGI